VVGAVGLEPTLLTGSGLEVRCVYRSATPRNQLTESALPPQARALSALGSSRRVHDAVALVLLYRAVGPERCAVWKTTVRRGKLLSFHPAVDGAGRCAVPLRQLPLSIPPRSYVVAHVSCLVLSLDDMARPAY
jgi:hypothetical protein